jgi:peptidyl-dipeptidase A
MTTRREFLIAGGAAMAATHLLPETAAAQGPDVVVLAAIDAHVKKLKPLEISAGLAWWEANTTGSEAAYKKKEETQNAIDVALADKESFKRFKDMREGCRRQSCGPLLDRQVELLYLAYLEKQVDPELLKQITASANAVEKIFNNYRAEVGGKAMTDSEVRKVLKGSTDTKHRQKVWEASKGVGARVEKDLKDLVGYRNTAATQLGFKNYHDMMLTLNEQTPEGIFKLFDELDELTREPFFKAKAEMDAKLAANVNKQPAALMPWDYQDPFFQEAPAIYATDLDTTYQTLDILKLCREWYAGIGLPIDDVIARSDLYEKKGKSPHAFCTDIDREGDVRVLANITPTEYWMGTMLHELGHAVYSSKNIPARLPYVLRGEAHILTTEGVAMQLQKFSKSRAWLEGMGVTVADGKAFDEAAAAMQRNELLIFSRWCQVMLRFEKGMYTQPNQDLNQLWWDLVAKYQGLTPPPGRSAPDYASKIHIVSAPVYYHNYMMGQLFASQVHHALVKNVYGDVKPNSVTYIGEKKVGKFMTEKVFAPGRSLSWNELLKHATGEELSAKAFAKDLQS